MPLADFQYWHRKWSSTYLLSEGFPCKSSCKKHSGWLLDDSPVITIWVMHPAEWVRLWTSLSSDTLICHHENLLRGTQSCYKSVVRKGGGRRSEEQSSSWMNCLKTETWWRWICALLELTGHLPATLSAFGTLGCGGGSEEPATGVTLRTPHGELLTPKHNITKFILIELPLFILEMGRGAWAFVITCGPQGDSWDIKLNTRNNRY